MATVTEYPQVQIKKMTKAQYIAATKEPGVIYVTVDEPIITFKEW